MDEAKRFEPRYVFRESEPNCFQLWPDDVSSELICPRCASTPWEREFPVYADEMPEPWTCDRCERRLTPRIPRWRLFKERYDLFVAFGNSRIKALKKALLVGHGKQYVSPERF